MRTWIPLAVLAVAICIPSVVCGQINYNEATNGDLGDPIDGSPTILGTLLLGDNSVSGTLSNTFTFLDRDAFTFTVAQGHQLDSFSFTTLDGGNRFYALSFQDTSLSTTTGGGNYYASLIGASSIGVNLLDGNLNDSGGSGGSGPLSAGDYTFWYQETDFSVSNYSLLLTTSSAVPEPSYMVAFFIGGGLMCLTRRRRVDSSFG